MKSKLTNNHNELIRLFAKIDDVEQQVDIPAGASILVDDYETRTIRVFKQRGFIEMESYELENQSDQVLKGKSEEQLLKEENTAIANALTRTVDDEMDSNNDEVLDHFHTTQTHEVDKAVIPAFETVEEEVERYIEDGFIKGEWTEDEEEFLRKNYPTKGRKFCANNLNRNESSVQKKINSLGLKKKKKKKR
jgi:hypothetical protein